MALVILSCHGHRRPRLYRGLIVAKINANCINSWFLGYLASLCQLKGCKIIRDAQGIMEASFWSGTSYVTPKTVEQQDIQSLLRIRANYIEMRTTVSNQIRGLMKEYGVFVAAGYQHLLKALPSIIERDNENGLSQMLITAQTFM